MAEGAKAAESPTVVVLPHGASTLSVMSANRCSQPPMDRQKTVSKAKLRAAKAGVPVFFTGIEALTEVAKPEGSWNWALVGPSPDKLPLCGGGAGSVEEMQMATGVSKNAHCFGLLRMTFGTTPKERHRWVFLHYKDPIDSGNFTQRERGQDMMKEPIMEKAVNTFVKCVTKLEIEGPENCTVDRFVHKIANAKGMDKNFITLENYTAALEEQFSKQKPAQPVLRGDWRARWRAGGGMALRMKLGFMMAKDEKELEMGTTQAEIAGDEMAIAGTDTPASLLTQPQVEKESEDIPTQRKKVKLYAKGDLVEIYSTKNGTWAADGEVVDIAKETFVVDSITVLPGSMKVVYSNRARFKWVAPQMKDQILRPSPRPRPPDSLVGYLEKETHGWITSWHSRYFELVKGFLQWWPSEQDAKKGTPPNGSINLLGLQMQQQETVLIVRAEVCQGVFFSFRAPSHSAAENWTINLWEHAGFCEESKDYYQALKGGVVVREELMKKMSAAKGRQSEASLAAGGGEILF